MRDPAAPEGPKDAEIPTPSGSSGTPGVSIPDRRRIDSDVRAFLREPSTPWIVFDQEGRPPSQLAVGEILRGPRRTLLSDYDFFPATQAVDQVSPAMHHVSALEPSSLSVSSDLAAASRAAASVTETGAPVVLDDGDADALEHADEDGDLATPFAAPMFGISRRVLGASAAGVALFSMLAVGALALHGASPSSTNSSAFRNATSAPAVAQPATRAAAAAVPAEIPPPDLDVKAPVAEAPVVAPAPVAVPTPVVVPTPVATAALPFPVSIIGPRDAAKGGKYARLTIAGEMRKDVFMDGKRMLGRGARSFSVMCGAHTISVGVRNDPHDVELPCNGELVVGK